jgi:hypothetical protein
VERGTLAPGKKRLVLQDAVCSANPSAAGFAGNDPAVSVFTAEKIHLLTT